jgi:hypothetical protein
MKRILTWSDCVFNQAHAVWETHASKRTAAVLLLAVYVASLIVIELGRRGLLPPGMAAMTPRSHYAAISMAFTFLLYLEVIDLVFGLAASVSRAVGKQFEIFSLILLRRSFKEFSHLPEPLQWPATMEPVLHILSDSCGAMLVFAVLVFYYRTLYHTPITADDNETANFISAKKIIALILLVVFIALGVYSVLATLKSGKETDFFATFYTILVFCDILIVLVSLRYSKSYPVVFRNSGFALATVALRLAMAAPDYYNAALGVGAVLYILGLNTAYNLFVKTRVSSVK